MTNDPASPLYYKFNFYTIPTDFEYFGVQHESRTWLVDRQQDLHDAVLQQPALQWHDDDLDNECDRQTEQLPEVGQHRARVARLERGVFRTGLWSEYASTDRHQTPADPRTWVDAALPNFHETFGTTTHAAVRRVRAAGAPNGCTITPGLKLAYYKHDFTQYADNGKTVGNLNGAPFVKHAAEYHSWLPSIDAHYLLQPDWSVYGQYGKGQNIPPTSIFDVKGAQVATLPKPIPNRYGPVRNGVEVESRDVRLRRLPHQLPERLLVGDRCRDRRYELLPKASRSTQGVEAESTILVGGGVAVYLNATNGSAKYTDTGLWAQNAPKRHRNARRHL